MDCSLNLLVEDVIPSLEPEMFWTKMRVEKQVPLLKTPCLQVFYIKIFCCQISALGICTSGRVCWGEVKVAYKKACVYWVFYERIAQAWYCVSRPCCNWRVNQIHIIQESTARHRIPWVSCQIGPCWFRAWTWLKRTSRHPRLVGLRCSTNLS